MQYTCTICFKDITNDAHGGIHPSAGDHDPAYHVAKSYGTWHNSLDIDFSKGVRGKHYARATR